MTNAVVTTTDLCLQLSMFQSGLRRDLLDAIPNSAELGGDEALGLGDGSFQMITNHNDLGM